MPKKSKTFYPDRSFDKNLTDFVALCVSKGWSFSGVETSQLKKDAVEQGKQREAHSKLESAYYNLHETFGTCQEARYIRFRKALKAARVLFHDDKAIMAELERFKRKIRQSPKKEESKPAGEK